RRALPRAVRHSADRRAWLVRLGAALVATASVIAALVLPCYLLTGRVLPSSLGTRVSLAGLLGPADRVRYFGAMFAESAYWLSEWWLLAAALVLTGLWLGWRRRRWACFALSAPLLAFLALRALVGLAPFNVEDRYVSYLWPLYALSIAAGGASALQGVKPGRRASSSALAGTLAAVAVYGLAAVAVPHL